MGFEYPRGPVLSTDLRRQVSKSVVRAHYRQLWRGMYLRRDVRPSFAVRTRALAVQYPESVLVGWSAAHLWRHPWVPARAEPHAASAMARRSLPGRRHTRLVPAAARIREVGGVRLSDPVATSAELCREASFVEAVIALDGLERAQPGTCAELAACSEEFPRTRFIRRVLDVVDARSPSREASWLRAHLTQAGIAGFRPGEQILVTAGGEPVAWAPLLTNRSLRTAIVSGPAPQVPGWRVISVPPGYARCEAAAVIARVDEVLDPSVAASVGGAAPATAGRDPRIGRTTESRANSLESSFWLG